MHRSVHTTAVRYICSQLTMGRTRWPMTQRGMGCCWSAVFPDFRHVDPFRRYSRSNSKVVRNRAKFWMFLPSQISGRPSKLYPRYHPCLAARRVEKFRENIPTSPEVIAAHTLNFKPNLCALAMFGQSLARVKIWGRSTHKGRNIVSRKIQF